MTTALYEVDFFLLVTTSLLLPAGIYATLLLKRSISQWTVLVLALVLITLSGIDFVLLQKLAEIRGWTPEEADQRTTDAFFALFDRIPRT